MSDDFDGNATIGTTVTPSSTHVLFRWDNHQEDREVYDEIFDEAILLISEEDNKPVGALLMMIINEWEKNRRNVALPIVNAVYEVALHAKAKREIQLESGLIKLFQEPEPA